MAGAAAFELGNCVATLLILRAADIRGSGSGLLAAVQSVGNLAASTIAGILWTTTSPTVAFMFLAAAMTVAVAVLALAARPTGHRAET